MKSYGYMRKQISAMARLRKKMEFKYVPWSILCVTLHLNFQRFRHKPKSRCIDYSEKC